MKKNQKLTVFFNLFRYIDFFVRFSKNQNYFFRVLSLFFIDVALWNALITLKQTEYQIKTDEFSSSVVKMCYVFCKNSYFYTFFAPFQTRKIWMTFLLKLEKLLTWIKLFKLKTSYNKFQILNLF